MTCTSLDFYHIEEVAGAGRGAIASSNIAQDTVVLRSGPPTAHVIFRQYRKEVCAQCFYYDRGRTLAVRDSSTGKVFCGSGCQAFWQDVQGRVGVTAWESLHTFVQAASKHITDGYDVTEAERRLDMLTIEGLWKQTEATRPVNGQGRKLATKQSVDPDILGFLLSSIISHYHGSKKWQEEVSSLAMDDSPYRSRSEFDAHLTSFLQLTDLLQHPSTNALIPHCNAEVCSKAVAAAGHNSFGIRSEDGEEYMGFALYPTASYFNHSCRPNVSKQRVGSQWIFTAAQDISNGEECCITYLGGDEKEMSLLERRDRLKQHWGFKCMCKLCPREAQ